MRKNQDTFTLRASVVAVHAAVIVMALLPVAHAEDATVAELTQTTNKVEVGIGNVSADSYKAGEYNGLQKKGPYANGVFELHGGDPNSAQRWNATGTNLGLENRNLSVDWGEQGKFRFNLGYDELRRNRSDSFQPPYLGAGSNTLSLPASWMVPLVPQNSAAGINARGLSSMVTGANALVSGAVVVPSAANLATSAAIQAADLPAFNNFDLHTKRTKYDGGFSYIFNTQWNLTASFRHEDKDGTKPMGTVTRFTGGDISTIIPDLIDQTHDQYNLGLNYKADKGFLQAAYYGSMFKNNVPSMSWANWATAGGATVATMSSAPSNQYHQFGLTGGYNYSPSTKLVVNASYTRNTQNDSFLTDTGTPLVPTSSLNGLVVTKDLNAKLTLKPVKDLNIAANYKYDDRDNRTAVNTYGFYDASEVPAAANANTAWTTVLGLPANTLRSNINLNANRPYSKKINQFNFDADYMVAKGNWLKGGFDWQKIDRYCTGSWIDCVDANRTNENTLRAEWRANPVENVSGRLAYAYSKRTVSNYNENAFLALVPMANVVPTGAVTASAYATMQALGFNGYGPTAGLPTVALTGNQLFFFPNNNALANGSGFYGNVNRISELNGMRRFFVADRNRDKLRSSINWQANEQLSFQGGLSYNKDEYANSRYGLQDAKNWALNLDGTYATESFSLTVFYTYEDQRSRSAGNTYTANSTAVAVNTFTAISGGCFATIALRNASNKIDPCLDWTMDMRDKVDTFGIALKKNGLMSGKLDLGGEVLYNKARTDYTPTGGNYANNPLAVAGAPAGTIAAFYIPATPLPTVSTDTIEVRLNGKYAINKTSAVRLGYSFLHMKASDWAYEGMQYGGLSGALPSNEKAPNYNVHVVAVSYTYSFH